MRVMRASLSHSLAKRPCSTRSGRDVSSYILKYQHFEINEQHFEIKDRNSKSVQQHFHFLFFFRKKMVGPPTLDVIFVGNFPQPPLNNRKKKE